MPRYFIIYKPFQVLSQFSSQEGKRTLMDLVKVPSDVYPVGRLDFDSEGLLILTNDRSLNHQLLNPRFEHEREYWVQVEGLPGIAAIRNLEKGLEISVDGKIYKTKPARVRVFETPPAVPDRYPPIRFRKNIPDTWISIALKEGKNRQVRKMTAAAGYPTLRLLRYRIERITIDQMVPGELREYSEKQIRALLF